MNAFRKIEIYIAQQVHIMCAYKLGHHIVRFIENKIAVRRHGLQNTDSGTLFIARFTAVLMLLIKNYFCHLFFTA